MRDASLGFCATKRPNPPDPDAYLALLEVRTCDISDAMHKGHTMRGIGPAWGPIPRIAGPAVTVSLPGSGFEMIGAALLYGEPGDILIIDTQGNLEAAYWGGEMTRHAMDRGLAGVVVDGCLRDRDEIQASAFPAFSRGVATRVGVYGGRFGEINMPVACGGVVVAPSDIVVADEHGVVAIPANWVHNAVRQTTKYLADDEHLPPPEDIQATLVAEGLSIIDS